MEVAIASGGRAARPLENIRFRPWRQSDLPLHGRRRLPCLRRNDGVGARRELPDARRLHRAGARDGRRQGLGTLVRERLSRRRRWSGHHRGLRARDPDGVAAGTPRRDRRPSRARGPRHRSGPALDRPSRGEVIRPREPLPRGDGQQRSRSLLVSTSRISNASPFSRLSIRDGQELTVQELDFAYSTRRAWPQTSVNARSLGWHRPCSIWGREGTP